MRPPLPDNKAGSDLSAVSITAASQEMSQAHRLLQPLRAADASALADRTLAVAEG